MVADDGTAVNTTELKAEEIATHVKAWYNGVSARDIINEQIAKAEKALKSIGVILPGMSKKQRSDAGKPKVKKGGAV